MRAPTEAMSDVPKIVHDRLRAGAPEGSHPEANVLTAFAEQALSPGEREDVVRHLARCGDCREVVALSIPPVEAGAQPEAAADGVSARRPGDVSRGWFAWPNLRWAAMAAAVVVVASVVILRPGKQREPTVSTMNLPAESTPPVADSSAKPAAPPADQRAPAVVAQTVKPDSSLLRAEPERRMRELPAASAPAKTAVAEMQTLVHNDKRPDSLQANAGSAIGAIASREQVEVTGSQPLVSTETAKAGQAASPQEVVVVNRAADVVQSAPTAGRLMASNVEPPPIEKAKPAAKEEALKAQAQDNSAQKKFAAAYSASDQAVAVQKLRAKQSKDVVAQWSLAEGKLQRSMDAGATWQIALQLQHPLLCFSSHGSDIWAGGQAGTLLHSSDSGATWTMVQPSTKAGGLGADIVAIEIRSQAEIVLSTSNNELWTTTDGGNTWQKK